MKELPVEVGSQTLGDALRARMNRAIPEGSNRDVLAQMAATMALVGVVRNQAGAGKMFRQTGEKEGPGAKIRVFESDEPRGGGVPAGSGESTRRVGDFSTPERDAQTREIIKMATDEKGSGIQLKSTKDLYGDLLEGGGSAKDPETGIDWGKTVQAMLDKESRDSRAQSLKEIRGWKAQDKPAAAPPPGVPKTVRPSAATVKSGPDKVRGNFMTRTVKAIEAMPPEQRAKMAEFRASQIEGVSPMTADALRKRFAALKGQ